MNGEISNAGSAVPREWPVLDWSAVEKAQREARRLRAQAFTSAALTPWRWMRAHAQSA